MSIRPLQSQQIIPCIDYRDVKSSILSISDSFNETDKALSVTDGSEETSPCSCLPTREKNSVKTAHCFTCQVEPHENTMTEKCSKLGQRKKGIDPLHNRPWLSIRYISTTPPCITFRDRVISLVNSKVPINLTENEFDTIIKVYILAWKIHTENPLNLLFVSSKSHAFTSINQPIIQANSTFDERYYKYAKLSLRMFPSGICSITIPKTLVLEGSCKYIKRELVIYPDWKLDIKRRCKVKSISTERQKKNFLKALDIISQIKIKNIIYPEIIFKKREDSPPQYLMQDCDMDLFELFSLMLQSSSSRKIYSLLSSSIEEQAHIILNIMIEITVAIRDLHRAGYLHNDIKPENILLKIEGAKYTAKIADLDFICDVANGEHLTVFRGTKKYCKTLSCARSIDTDLYALSKTFFLGESASHVEPSFMHAFTILKSKALEKEQLELDGKLSKIIKFIQTLCFEIESSCEKKNPKEKLNIDTILMKLSILRADCFSIDSPKKALASTDVKNKAKRHARSNSV